MRLCALRPAEKRRAGRFVCVRVYLRAQALRDEDGDHNLIEDLRRQLVLRLERVRRHVRRPSDGQLAEERRGDEADNREHRLAAVHQLRLAHVVEVAAELGDRRAEAERVEANIPGHRAVERRRLLEEGDRGRFLDHHRLHGRGEPSAWGRRRPKRRRRSRAC